MAKSSTVSVKIISDASGFGKGFQNAAKEAESFGQQIEQKFGAIGDKLTGIGDKVASAGSNLTSKVSLPLLAIGGLSFKAAADVQDAMGATEQIYKDASGSVQSWAKGLPSYYGIATGEALEYANIMGSMMQNLGGLTEAEAAKQSATLIELAGDLTAMYGGSTQDAMYALNAALKGNTTMLDNYGMTATAAQVEQKALEMGLISSAGEMDTAAKQAATLALIMEQSGAAQGQAAREADGASGQMRAFTTDVKNLSAEIGTHLLPIVTPWIAKAREWFDRFKKLSPETQKLIVKIGLFAAALGPALLVVGKITSGVGKFVGSIGKVIGVASKVANAVKMMNLAFLSSPITWIVIAVVALVAALVLAYQKVDWFRDAVDRVINVLKTVWNWISENLLPILKTLAQWVGTQLVNNVKRLADFWSKILWPALKKIADFIVNNVVPVIRRIISTFIDVQTKVWEVIGKIVGFVTGIPGRISGTISTLWDGIKTGITGAYNWVKEQFTKIVNHVTGLPGRIRRAASGMWNGIKTAFKSAINWIIDGWNGMEFKIPGFKIGPVGYDGFTLGLPKIPKLHTGGVVNAYGRDETLRVLQHGEVVLPAGAGVAGGGTVIHVHVAGSVISERDLLKSIQNGLAKETKLFGNRSAVA